MQALGSKLFGRRFARVLASLGALTLVTQVQAVRLDTVYNDLPPCDQHGDIGFRHELGGVDVNTGSPGDPRFSPDQEIESSWIETQRSTCQPQPDDPSVPNYLVTITNLSPYDYVDLFFVIDPNTAFFSNFDGFVFEVITGVGGEAMRIDNLGVNQPLLFESLIADLIFQAGETWEFLVVDFKDFVLPGLGPRFTSVGLDSPDGGGTPFSTASLVANRVPEPAVLLLFGTGALGLLLRGRRGAGR